MHWPEDYKVKVKQTVYDKIAIFYYNVSLKYLNSYGYEEIDKLIRKNIKSISNINKTKLISGTILDKWKDYGRVVIGQWNFAVKIEGNKMTIVDACHRLNMTNNPEIQEQQEFPYHNPRINNITFPSHIPGKPYFIRTVIDGDSAGIRQITKDEYERAAIDKEFAIQLAERYYHKELKENRFNIDQFLHKGRKL